MKNYIVVCLLFGIALGCILSLGNKIGKVKNIYGISINIIIVTIAIASIYILSMLKVDYKIKHFQVIFGFILEIFVASMVSFILNKIVNKL